MKLIACSVFDVKANSFAQPFYVPNINFARRSFGDAVFNDQSMISKHPSDYVLYQVGIFDDVAGVFDNRFNKPEFLANASDFLKPEVVDGENKAK